MASLSKNQKIALAVVAVVAVGVSAYFFLRGESSAPESSSGEMAASFSGSGEIGADLLRILADLRQVKLDEKFFQSRSFEELRDFEVIISPQPVGRKNPFIPLDGIKKENKN